MKNNATDTIAAIATAPGEGAIAIVRISGPDSLALADRLFKGQGLPPSQRPANSFVHGFIVGGAGVADEVVLLIYRAPHSYTREDSIEIQGHGGSTAAKRILRQLVEAGARLADPGEFTKRAFLNGRLDLLQAEGILDLIRARTDRAAETALEQMQGTLSRSFDALYDETLTLAADLEATLDFSEDELPESVTTGVLTRLRATERHYQALLDSWDEGHLLRDGALVVIAGKPNVGKSTLLNALLGKDRAIVTPIAGTTRDTIEEQTVICGYPVRLVDTAGLRDSPCEIESEGVRRATSILSHADLILYVIDGSLPWTEEDALAIKSIPNRARLIVINKSDITRKKSKQPLAPDQSSISVSAARGTGLDELKRAIITALGIRGGQDHAATISERHRRLLVLSHKDLTEAGLLLTQTPPDPALAASRLRGALETLGEATGRVYHEELLNSIFSRFCIGK